MKNLRLKTGLRYGIVTSVLASLIGLALMFTGMADYSGSTGGWTSFLILGLGIYLASEGYKKETGGYMTHTDVTVTSLWLGLFSGILSGIIGLIHMNLDPTLMEKARNITEARLEAQGQSDEVIEQSMKMMDMVMQPVPMFLIILFSSLLSCLFLGAVLGFFLKKEKDVFEA